MSDTMSFFKDQLPRAVAHGVGAAVGVMAAPMIPVVGDYPMVVVAGGVYLGNIAYIKYSTDGDIDWTLDGKGDTIAAMVGAIGMLYLGVLGDPRLSAAAGAVAGDIVASYLGY
jgi:hypothetical protein